MEIFCSLRPNADEEAADDDESLQFVLAVAFSGIEIMLLLVFCSAEACAEADAVAVDEDDDDDFLSSVMVELTIFCREKH